MAFACSSTDGSSREDWEIKPRVQSKSVFVDLEAGKAYELKLEYFEDIRDAEVRLAWRLPGAKAPFDEALEAARSADAIVFVGGLTGDVEGEEMKVSYPGFAGGDRTDLRLAGHAAETARSAAGHRQAGRARADRRVRRWQSIGRRRTSPAILMAWYPGQRGGTAVADVLFGDVNPGGRLPVTFYKASEKLPAFDDYDMHGRTYRYFDGEPLYPFGHGLSYTRFEYSDLEPRPYTTLRTTARLRSRMQLKNVGSRAGDEVVQMYLRAIDPSESRSRKELRGIERVTLKPGESRRVTFTVVPQRDLAYYNVASKAHAVDRGEYELQLGASSADIRLKAVFSVAGEPTRQAQTSARHPVENRAGEALRGAGFVH